MNDDLCGVCTVMAAFLGLLALVWLDRLGDQARAEDDAAFAESIRHLPLEVQARLLAGKLHHDARRDRG